MAYIDGWMGLATAISGGTATEATGGGYSRQPCRFSILPAHWAGVGAARAMTPVIVNASVVMWTAAAALYSDTLAGRVIYDAPTGGNILLTATFGTGPRPFYQGGPSAILNEGDLVLEAPQFTWSYSGQVAPGTALGTCYDAGDLTGARSPVPGETPDATGTVALIQRGVLTAGVQLVINRGALQTAASYAALPD